MLFIERSIECHCMLKDFSLKLMACKVIPTPSPLLSRQSLILADHKFLSLLSLFLLKLFVTCSSVDVHSFCV